ncbi:MAG: hypothetical protein K2Q14_07860 [Gammaproteobacteria bacterium]|nr:hypothetical protein [Gammaproteobacteria bacterium]
MYSNNLDLSFTETEQVISNQSEFLKEIIKKVDNQANIIERFLTETTNQLIEIENKLEKSFSLIMQRYFIDDNSAEIIENSIKDLELIELLMSDQMNTLSKHFGDVQKLREKIIFEKKIDSKIITNAIESNKAIIVELFNAFYARHKKHLQNNDVKIQIFLNKVVDKIQLTQSNFLSEVIRFANHRTTVLNEFLTPIDDRLKAYKNQINTKLTIVINKYFSSDNPLTENSIKALDIIKRMLTHYCNMYSKMIQRAQESDAKVIVENKIDDNIIENCIEANKVIMESVFYPEVELNKSEKTYRAPGKDSLFNHNNAQLKTKPTNNNNTENCRDFAEYLINDISKISANKKPEFITHLTEFLTKNAYFYSIKNDRFQRNKILAKIKAEIVANITAGIAQTLFVLGDIVNDCSPSVSKIELN